MFSIYDLASNLVLFLIYNINIILMMELYMILQNNFKRELNPFAIKSGRVLTAPLFVIFVSCVLFIIQSQLNLLLLKRAKLASQS